MTTATTEFTHTVTSAGPAQGMTVTGNADCPTRPPWPGTSR